MPEYVLRQVIQFLDMFIKLYIVGVMLLYILRVRLPLSYRIWSGLCGLSLLIYNQIFYLQYQDQLALKALSVSNGPYFASFRVMEISTSHIFPTMSLVIIIFALFILLYFPQIAFNNASESICDYIRDQGLNMFDSCYFFACRMMYFYIGKLIKQSSTASLTYIIVAGVYGLFILLALIRTIYKYHKGTMQNFAYQSPIHLYTILAPASLIGLALATSQVILVIVYCSPFGLLILIVLLNRNMKIITKNNIKFFITQVIMIGLTLAFIFAPDPYRTYIMVGIIFLSTIIITIQVWFLYASGFELGTENKVYPILDNNSDDIANPKKIYGEEKDGYF